MNAPKKLTWFIAFVLGVLGIVGTYVAIPFVTAYAFWFVVAGFAILTLGCLIKGL